MTKPRSLGQRLRRAGSAGVRREIITDWADTWLAEQQHIVQMLEQAIKTDDYGLYCRATGQLKTVTDKRFNGLLNAIKNMEIFCDD